MRLEGVSREAVTYAGGALFRIPDLNRTQPGKI